MQEPLFKKFRVNPQSFWDEVNATVKEHVEAGDNVSTEAVILNQIVRYVKDGKFRNLDNKGLRSLGSRIAFYKGLPEFFVKAKNFVKTKTEYRTFNISLEHYVVSTGLRQMIRGSKIAPFIDDIWGCEFSEVRMPSRRVCIGEIAYLLDHTTKTRAVFEINKGCNKHPIDVNANIAFEDRRVLFENMIYIADGPSDIPAFSIINRFEGRT